MIGLNKLVLILLLFLSINVSIQCQDDVLGSKDHSLISRYPASVIKWYDIQEFDKYKIAVGPVTCYRFIEKWHGVEGKVTRIFYSLTGTRSVSEVYYNYEKALKKNGFEVLTEGLFKSRNVKKEIGGRNWLGVYFAENSVPPEVGLLTGSSTVGGSAFVAGKLKKNNAVVYIAISLAQHRDDMIYYIIDIIEEAIVEDEFIFVNADMMKNEIEANGKITLYGIYFDTNKATLKAESETTFKEIVTLLKDNPDYNLYVVGHTDMNGSYSHNMKLSNDRSNAVVNELVTKYKINKARLSAEGIGPLVPVSSNKNELGRKQNRRVELAKK